MQGHSTPEQQPESTNQSGGVALKPWLLCIPIVLLALYLFLMLLSSPSFPPRWYERSAQRKKVAGRVQIGGGWEALRRECIDFAQTNESVYWRRWQTNATPKLPPTIAALQPQQVEYTSPKLLGRDSGEPQVPIIRIKVFGAHATGGHSTPYFGLEVVATPSNEDYTPKAHPAASGNAHVNYRKVCEGVYEIF
jgi:hypothetical protein